MFEAVVLLEMLGVLVLQLTHSLAIEGEHHIAEIFVIDTTLCPQFLEYRVIWNIRTNFLEFPTSSQRIRRTLSEKQTPIRIVYTSIAILDDDFGQWVDGFWDPSKLDLPVLHIGNTFLSNLVQKITNILHPSWESIHHKLIILPADTINRIQILLNVSHHRVYLSLTVGESFHHISSLLLGILSLL